MEKAKQDITRGIHVNGQFFVRSVSYHSLEHLADEKAELQLRDRIVCEDSNLDGFRLAYSRVMDFLPSGNFDISVTIEADVAFDDNAGNKVLGTEEKVREWIENNKVRIVDTFGMPATASAMISTCLVHANVGPIPTPPTVQLSEKE